MATRRTHAKRPEKGKRIGEKEKTGKKRLELFCCLFLVLGIIGMVWVLVKGEAGNLRERNGYYEIWSKEDYKRFWEMVYRRPDCNGRLMKDIVLNDFEDWENWWDAPPKNKSVEVPSFSGIFDGNEYSIYGLYSENGYGLAKDNLGIIKNLTIKNSLITGKASGHEDGQGGYFNGGICYRNYRQIQNCRFEGVLCNREYHQARAAGICIINYGSIEQCVYKGSMQYIWHYWVYSDRAGICTENRGEVKNCCNLSEERMADKGYYTEKAEGCFDCPIADGGMENCYVVKDSDWGRLRKEPVIGLTEEQMYALPWLLEGNFYPLLEKELKLPFADSGRGTEEAGEADKGMPEVFGLDVKEPDDYKFGRLRGIYQDSMVARILRLLAEHEGKIPVDMGLEEIEKQDRSSFAVKLRVKEQEVLIKAYPAEKTRPESKGFGEAKAGAETGICLLKEDALENASQGDYEKLWEYCADILKNDGIKDWKHNTYQLTKLPGRIGNCLDFVTGGPETLVQYQAEGKDGFFCVEENMLYRVEAREQDQVEGTLTEHLLQYLIEGWRLSDGISWDDERLQMAVYVTLWEEGAGAEIIDAASWKEAAFSNEEVMGLKKLTIEGAGNRESYEDLQYLQGLKSLTLRGKKDGRKLQLYFPDGSLQKLEELVIENCRLGINLQAVEELPALERLRLDQCYVQRYSDLGKVTWIQGLLKRCRGLKELSLKADGITDVSELAKLQGLEKLDLSFNEIEDFSPLCKLRNLKSLAINDNPGTELGELINVPDLWVGKLLENEAEMEEAQQVLNEIYSGGDSTLRTLYGFQVEDQARGDLNGDGIEDMAIIGIGRESIDKAGTWFSRPERKVHLLLGTGQGFRQVQTIYLSEAEEEKVGITEEDPYSKVAISGEHLIIQIWTQEQKPAIGGKWKSVCIYTWKDGKLKPEERRETDYGIGTDDMTWKGFGEGSVDDADREDGAEWEGDAGTEVDADEKEGTRWKDDIVKETVYHAIGRRVDSLSGKELEQALGEVRELNIYEYYLVSTLEDLRMLPNLESLSLFGEKQACKELELTGELVPKLKELFLSNMGIENVDFLEGLPALERLTVSQCNVKDISAVWYQRELRNVSFYGNQIENIWPLRGCKKIEKLTLADNQIKDISVLASLEKLRAAELSGNWIRNIEALQWLPELNSLSLEHNQIQDISALRELPELQFLWLSGNRIEDFQPIMGLGGLLSLSVDRNPEQNIGNLLFVPHFTLNGGFSRWQDEEKEEAQVYLDFFYGAGKLVAEDMLKGDLNGDGILDMVVVGCTDRSEEEGEKEIFYGAERNVYVFLGKANGSYRALPPVETDGPYGGGPFGDPYQGIMITEGRLVVQTYGGSSWRWGYVNVYEYENGTMVQKWELCREHSTFAGGYDFTVKNMETGYVRYYVIAGGWEKETRQLLLAEGYNKAVLQVYQPEISEEYYDYQLHSTFYDTKERADYVLDMAAERFLQSENRTIGECYPSEEIKDNFELLVGVELPAYFYKGYSRKGLPVILYYDGCRQDEDGNFVHRLAMVASDGGFWQQKEIITYEEAEGVLVVG